MFQDKYFQLKGTEDGKIITGSNPGLVILCNDYLRKHGLWIPTISQARTLDEKIKLPNSVYRDYGIVVPGNSQQKFAKNLIKQAQAQRFNEFPLLFSICDLTLEDIESQFKPDLIKNPREILYGQEAEKAIKKMRRKDPSHNGVSNGNELAVVEVLDENTNNSDGYGRVDYACGKASSLELTKAQQRIAGDSIIQQLDALAA